MAEVMEGRAAAGADRRAAHRPGDEGRAAGRDRRPGARRCARTRCRCRRGTTTCSTPAAPAAIAPARSTSRRAPRSSSRRAACASRSTATDRCRASAGSADVFEALGVRVTASPAVVERCLAEAGIGFFFAPTFHPSMRHAGAGAPRARRPDGVQPARPADESGRRDAAARRRAAAGAHRAAGARADAARLRARLGRARRRRHRRDLDDRLHEDLRVPRRRGQHVLPASGRRRPAEGAARRRCRAATRTRTRAIIERVLAGERGAGARRRAAERRRGAVHRRRGGVGRGRHRCGRRARSIAATPGGRSSGWSSISTAEEFAAGATRVTPTSAPRHRPICSRRSSPRRGASSRCARQREPLAALARRADGAAAAARPLPGGARAARSRQRHRRVQAAVAVARRAARRLRSGGDRDAATRRPARRRSRC